MALLRRPRTRVALVTAAAFVLMAVLASMSFGRSSGTLAGSAGTTPDTIEMVEPPTSVAPVTAAPTTEAPTTEAPATTTTAVPVLPDSPFGPADPLHPARIVDPGIDRPDASIVWDTSTGLYYLFTTNWQFTHVPSWSSPSPVGPWTYLGEALPTIPGWANDDGVHLWAPDVVAFHGVWAMWGSAFEASSSRMCLYRAVAATAAGPYSVDPDEPGLCTKTQGGSIDPQQIQDDQGRWWMVFKVDGNEIREPTSIVTVRLDDAGHPVGQPKVLITSDLPWEGGLIESPAMFKDAKRGQWWLAFSAGPFSGPDATYQIVATPCSGPAGPCLDTPVPLVGSNEQGKGPGEEGVFVDRTGTIWMAYGPWAPFFAGKPRPLALVKIGFWTNGLPYVGTP